MGTNSLRDLINPISAANATMDPFTKKLTKKVDPVARSLLKKDTKKAQKQTKNKDSVSLLEGLRGGNDAL